MAATTLKTKFSFRFFSLLIFICLIYGQTGNAYKLPQLFINSSENSLYYSDSTELIRFVPLNKENSEDEYVQNVQYYDNLSDKHLKALTTYFQ